MITELTVFACFITGIVSTLHCAGMCGGIATMLSLQIDSAQSRFFSLAIYNIGRIFSYAMIGLLIGIISQSGLSLTADTAKFHTVLQIFSSIILLLIALQIIGALSFLARFERIMSGLWKPIQSLLKNILPAKTVSELFILGLIWGWLPCGLVYSIALLATTSGNAIASAAYLIAFGLGTLPGMMAICYSSSFLDAFRKNKLFRYLSAAILIMIAVITIYLAFSDHSHLGHSHH